MIAHDCIFEKCILTFLCQIKNYNLSRNTFDLGGSLFLTPDKHHSFIPLVSFPEPIDCWNYLPQTGPKHRKKKKNTSRSKRKYVKPANSSKLVLKLVEDLHGDSYLLSKELKTSKTLIY